MEERTNSPQPVEAQPSPLGEFARLTGVLFDPNAAFPDIVARPRWWVPLVLLAVLTLSFLAVFHRLGGGWPGGRPWAGCWGRGPSGWWLRAWGRGFSACTVPTF